jgi:DNA-binding NtrC family response regulator
MIGFDGNRTSGIATPTTAGQTAVVPGGAPVPGLVLAWRPPGLVASDRAPIDRVLTVGRSSTSRWCIPDWPLSRRHFQIAPAESGFVVRDAGSRNGTVVDGTPLEAPRAVGAGAVIRAGGCVFVVVGDLNALSGPGEDAPGRGIVGAFHAGAIVARLRVAAGTGRHVLLEGESGSGKELAAAALHELYRAAGRAGPLQTHNAACFAGEDDAVGGLFGVTRGAFTGVGARAGTLLLADGGTLFLDEVHNLPPRVQRSLLRFVEDGLLQPLGQGERPRRVDVRLVLGTNIPVERSCDEGRLAGDLVARLHRVWVPPLRERRADVPSLFVHMLDKALPPVAAEAAVEALDSELVERLCLHDYRRGNVRELVDMAAVVGARLAEGATPTDALRATLDEALAARGQPREPEPETPEPLPRSLYERHREEIIEAYRGVDDNLTRLEQVLAARDIPCNRRWLAVFLDKWRVRPLRRKGP